MKDFIAQELANHRDLSIRIATDEALLNTAQVMAGACINSLAHGGKILFCGNGGSASDAQHLAAEIVGRLAYDRPAMAAIALTTDTSILTAVGNDYGYDAIFSRQVEGLGNKGDVLVGISTSGNSSNVVAALKSARAKGLVTLGFTGEGGGMMNDLCDHILRIPHPKTHHVQETHITFGHIICALVERHFHPKA